MAVEERRQLSKQITPTSRRQSPRSLPPSTDQFQSLANHWISLQPSQKRRFDETVDTRDEKPLKRAKVTAKNLKQLEIGGRPRTSAAGASGGSSTTTTTTDKHFGAKLQKNGIIHRTWEAQDADDAAEVREFLDRSRASEPPNENLYQRYLRVTEDYDNELSVEFSAYPLLSKRSGEAELSGYIPRLSHAWSALDNNLTTGLSDAQPDLAESYSATDYPPQAVEALSGNLAPSSFNESMATYAVEFKSSSGDMKEAKLQCAYNGALMTFSAEAIHAYMKKPGKDFYGKTQAITVATNGRGVEFYGHYARIPSKAGPLACTSTGKKDSEDTETTIKYFLYRITSDHPRDSPRDLDNAYKHVRNAQKFGFELASERKDALWAFSEIENAQTNVPITLPESSNTQPVSTQEAPPAKPKRARQKAINGGPVDRPKARRSAKSRNLEAV